MFEHLLGMKNANGQAYLFWSGVGGDLLTAIPLFWALIVWYRHNKCHNCFRLGHHVPHIHYPVCKHHVPVAMEASNV